MQIQQYNFEPENIDKLIGLIDSLYPKSQYLDLYKHSVKESLSSKNPFFKYGRIANFLATEKQVVIGHISAIIDPRLPDIGLVGFFECSSQEAASQLIKGAVNFLKEQGLNKIRGPINLSIWHRYRFMNPTSEVDQFLLEPFNRSEYPEYFLQNGFVVAENYLSGLRNNFTNIIQYSQPGFEESKTKGFVIRPIDLSKYESELKIFHQLSLEIFKESWSFVPVSFEEFKSLYLGLEKRMDPQYCEFICADGKEVGFCFSIPDFLSKEKSLILKTIGLLPEYQKQNLGSALIYSQHIKALRDGYKTIIYALMREGNRASKINPYGAKIFRKYQSYELSC